MDTRKLIEVKQLLLILEDRHNRFIDSINDAVVIAVNQVQDIRIKNLSPRQELSFGEFFIEVAFIVFPSSMLVGKALSVLFNESFASALRSRMFFKLFGNYDSKQDLRKKLEGIKENTEKIKIQENYLKNANVSNLYSENIYNFFETIDTKISEFADKLDNIQEIYQKVAKNNQKITDTPSTSILSSVYSFSRNFKYTQSILINNFRILIEDKIDEQSLEIIKDELLEQIALCPHDYEKLRKALIIWLEFCIWIKIYEPNNGNIEKIQPARLNEGSYGAFSPGELDIYVNGSVAISVPKEIRKYLEDRIINSPYFDGKGRYALAREWEKTYYQLKQSNFNFMKIMDEKHNKWYG